jgi:two-component system KDP operon response regulator KdpE
MVKKEIEEDMEEKRILVIDDDPETLQLVRVILSRAGATVYEATNGPGGLRLLYDHRPHLVILDVMMPYLDGWDMCSRIQQISNTPIIFLTALGGENYVVRGLDCGAVDYVTKPFFPKVLVARARAALRQAVRPSAGEELAAYADDRLTFNLDRRQLLVHGELVRLSATEYRLLAYLVRNAGRVLTFRQILENVWGWEYHDHVEYVHVYVSRLRQKLEEDPKRPAYILSERGVGYRFEEQASRTY